MMPRAFADDYRSCVKPEERFGGGADQLSIRVYGFPGDVCNDVGFEQNRLSADIEVEEPQYLPHTP